MLMCIEPTAEDLALAMRLHARGALEQLQRDADRDCVVVKSLRQAKFERASDRHFAFAFVGVPEEFWKPVMRDHRYVPLIAENEDDAMWLLGS